MPLLDDARARGAAVRVWPLSRLQPVDHSAEHRRLVATYGEGSLVPPLSLLEYAPAHRPAMLAAFGRTLIAADDATAARVVAESGCPCITPAGTLHERGKLTGGWRSAELFVALLERQRARAAGDAAARRTEEAAARLALRCSRYTNS